MDFNLKNMAYVAPNRQVPQTAMHIHEYTKDGSKLRKTHSKSWNIKVQSILSYYLFLLWTDEEN